MRVEKKGEGNTLLDNPHKVLKTGKVGSRWKGERSVRSVPSLKCIGKQTKKKKKVQTLRRRRWYLGSASL